MHGGNEFPVIEFYDADVHPAAELPENALARGRFSVHPQSGEALRLR